MAFIERNHKTQMVAGSGYMIRLFALTVYLMLVALGLLHHDFWRDELQIWQMAESSNGFIHFLELRSIESNTILWHLVVYMLNVLFANPVSLKIWSFFMAVGIGYMILFKSPFHLKQKVLLLFGYYSIFEFVIISRSYSLSFLLLMLLLDVLKKGNRKYITPVHSLLILTNVPSAILGGAFMVYLYVEVPSWRRKLIFPFMILLFAFVDVAWQTFVVWETSHSTLSLDVYSLLYKPALFFKGMFPMPGFHLKHFWNTHILDSLPVITLAQGVQVVGSVFVIVYIVISLKGEKATRWFFTLSIGVLFFLFTILWGGSQRHWGYFYLVVLSLVWLHPSLFKSRYVSFLFLMNSISGVLMFGKVLNQPISEASNVAQYLQEQNQEDVLAGYPDFTNAPVSHFLEKPIYSFQHRDFKTFTDWNRPDEVDEKEFLQQLDKLLSKNQTIIYLESLYFHHPSRNLTTHPKYKMVELKTFDEGLEIYENYKVFSIKKGSD